MEQQPSFTNVGLEVSPARELPEELNIGAAGEGSGHSEEMTVREGSEHFEESIPVEESIPGVERNIVEERIAGDEERVAADLGKYGCLPCGMKFRDTPNLKRHVGLVHEVRQQPVMCPRPWCKAQTKECHRLGQIVWYGTS